MCFYFDVHCDLEDYVLKMHSLLDFESRFDDDECCTTCHTDVDDFFW